MTGEHEAVQTTVGDREVTVTENSMHPADLVFVQKQAILAGLPMHAIGDQLNCDFGMNCATSRKKRTLQDVPKSPAQRLQERLQVMSSEYRDYKDFLDRLEIICDKQDASSSTIVCLADHEERRLYVAARGTHRSISRVSVEDWKSNLQIAIGSRPYGRTELALEHYRQVRREHKDYITYGSGHSLGGAVMIQLATCVEDEPEFRFERVDAFNTAVAPFERNFIWLQQTELHVHRVPGDWASAGLNGQQAPNLHMHPVQTHVSEIHSLQHFLPIKESEREEIERTRRLAEQQQQQQQRHSITNTLLGVLTACIGNRQKDPNVKGLQPIIQGENSPIVSLPSTPRRGSSDHGSYRNVSEDDSEEEEEEKEEEEEEEAQPHCAGRGANDAPCPAKSSSTHDHADQKASPATSSSSHAPNASQGALEGMADPDPIRVPVPQAGVGMPAEVPDNNRHVGAASLDRAAKSSDAHLDKPPSDSSTSSGKAASRPASAAGTAAAIATGTAAHSDVTP